LTQPLFYKVIAKVLITLVTLFSLLALATPANANSYSPFGNNHVPDCAFATDAYLVLHEYPNAKITTAEVVSAWRSQFPGPNSGPIGYLQQTGFDGHVISGSTDLPLTRAAIIAGAANGGISAGVWGGTHAVAIIAADRKGIRIVNAGQIQFVVWSKVFNPRDLWLVQAIGVTWPVSSPSVR
jgi:hypothetical protein